MLGLKSVETAAIVISGMELAERIKKGQFKIGKLRGRRAMPLAAFEGYAQFVSGAVWNNVGTSADCKAVVGSDPYPLLNDVVDLNRFDRLFEKNYNENNHPDEGVEQDWAQFFWGYRTDVWPLPTGGLPTDAQIVNIFVFTWKWPKHHGFFADLTGGVSLAVPSPPGNPTASLMRFAATADAAGVNH